ncbi:MAG: hypothetical protein N2440_01850 [Actinobacteria bacterium]|nr:hypothetical protein [Actinomycetota bacterium]
MRLPWSDLSRDEYVRLCYEIAPLIGFQRRTFIESGPHSSVGYDIIAYRENEILPSLGYPEKWLLAAIPYKPSAIDVEDIEFIKKWADEPLHEVDYVLLITPSRISPNLEEWFLKFNRFPIKKYKFKFLTRVELDQIVCSNLKVLNSFFPGFEPKELGVEEKNELLEAIVRRILNFRSDLGIVDIYLNLLFTVDEESQLEIINKIASVWSFDGFEKLKRWNSGWVLIRLAKLNPKLLPIDMVEKVAIVGDSAYKAQAAHIYAWLSITRPESVNPEILAKMLDDEIDYFIQVPLTKAIANLIEVNDKTFNHIVALINDDDASKRYSGAKIISAIAEENPMLVPPSIIQKLKEDKNSKIRQIGNEVAENVLSFWEAPLRAQYKEALENFEKKNYDVAAQIFSKLSKKNDFSLSHEAKWWAGYCNYLERNYNAALHYFKDLARNESSSATAYWWQSLCFEKMGDASSAASSLQEVAKILLQTKSKVRISPEKELSSEEINPLLFKRLRELS